MAFWWVNHKQTFKSEISGRYIWSPKRKANGGFNQTYENLTLVKPGDTVVSFADGHIKALGVATSVYRDETKPEDFGAAGDAWHTEGWLVPVSWVPLAVPFKPKDHISKLVDKLPEKYSPIQDNGNGNQGVYLAAISDDLGGAIVELAGMANHAALIDREDEIAEVEEDQVQKQLIESTVLPSTEVDQLIKARRGQGVYRTNLQKLEKQCRLTGVTDQRLLVASHIKPWKDCSNEERLDGHNGFLLSPHVDRLFDRHLISFNEDGSIVTANIAIVKAMLAWGLDPKGNVGAFTEKQMHYLAQHREKTLAGGCVVCSS